MAHRSRGFILEEFGVKHERQLKQTLCVALPITTQRLCFELGSGQHSKPRREGEHEQTNESTSAGVPYSTILFPGPRVWDQGQIGTTLPETVAASPPSLPCILQPSVHGHRWSPLPPTAEHLNKNVSCKIQQVTLLTTCGSLESLSCLLSVRGSRGSRVTSRWPRGHLVPDVLMKN